MSMKYIVPALAVAGRAVATSSCSNTATTTIQSSGDASAIASCGTYTGTIALATGISGAIDLGDLEEIQGSLYANNVTQLTSFSASSLTTISDEFNLNGLTILSTLSFPVLSDVGSIIWEALPALQSLSFSSTGVQTATELNIQNTFLSSLDGINLQVVDTVYLTNNPYLDDVTMQLGNITTSLTIEANGGNVTVSLPNLIWANNMTLRNVTTFSTPSLVAVNGSLGFYSNEFSDLSAANLTSVGESLSFVSNTELTNVSMPLLKTIGGGFQIANNTEYKIVDGFPLLATIGGALDFYGNFTEIVLPSLTDVRGAFNIQSSADISANCTTFKKLDAADDIKGKYYCEGTIADPGSSTPTSTSSSSSSSASSSKGAAANNVVVPAASGLMAIVAFFVALI